MAHHTRIYPIAGMTCEHCVRSIAEEVSALPGVDAVDVDLASARLTVVGNVTPSAVVGAVREAGYEVAS